MQTRPLRQKRDNSTRIVSIALVISRLIIFAGVRWVFFADKGEEQPTNLIEQDSMDQDDADTEIEEQKTVRYMGEKILAAGILTPTDSFTTYTHNFVSEQGDVFGLKSKDIDLYTYEGKVQLKGSIEDFKQELPIILVTEIIADGEGTGNDTEIDANADYYLFKNEKIGFDLSISEGFVVEREGDEIHLKDATQDNATMLKISPFVCTPGDSLRDCTTLKNTFIERKSDSFVSSQGVKFYNLTETITWLAFDPTGAYGYYLTPTNETEFASFSNLMGFVNEDIFKEALTEEVSTMCKNIDYTMTDTDTISYDYSSQGSVLATLVADTEDGATMTCVLGLRLGNSIKVSAQSFSVSGGEEAQDEDADDDQEEENIDDNNEDLVDEAEKENEDTEEGLTPPENTVSQVPENWSGSGWFKYASVRGYDVYFSSKSISYAGTILPAATDLGVPGLNCVYRVNVIQWKRAEEVETSPDVQLYECTGSAAGAVDLQQVGSSGGKIFVAKRLTNNLGDMSIIVE